LYAHVFVARAGFSADPSDPEYDQTASFSRTHPLVVYLPKPKIDKRKKLWSKNEEAAEQEAAEVLSCAFATVLKPCMFGEEK
jgi:hypothetical protein